MSHIAKQPLSVAVICANGLGDALVQMVLANNLAQQHCQVTFFSSIVSSLDELVESFRIKPFPDYVDLQQSLNKFDLVLYDSSGHYVRQMPREVESWCEQNGICYRMSDAQPRHQSVSSEAIATKIANKGYLSADQFKALNSTLRGKFLSVYRPTVVEQLCTVLTERIGLEQVSKGNGLKVFTKQTNSKKVIIHPTSSNSKKNWSQHNFVQLCTSLKNEGFEPVITVAPDEREHWLKLVKGEVDVPLFNTIKDLALFYHDAVGFIGNDSGNAHLASSLGVPTLQMFRGWKKKPPWRAGWGSNKVLVANFPFNIFKKYWVKGVSVDRVMREFRLLIYDD